MVIYYFLFSYLGLYFIPYFPICYRIKGSLYNAISSRLLLILFLFALLRLRLLFILAAGPTFRLIIYWLNTYK